MPYSFTQIEQEKTGTIQFSLAFLLFFYFLSALAIVYFCKVYFHFSSIHVPDGMPMPWPSLGWSTTGWTLAGSTLVGLIHWQFSQDALIDKVLQMMSARMADAEVDEERVFRNVVEEAAVATGGKYRIEPYILPTAAMNAFALQDFQGRCVIGITDGLLKRLNREQLEAVVGHEAGHIASGDCVETTTTSALFKTFDNICDITLRLVLSSGRVGMVGASFSDRGSRRGSDGRVIIFFLLLFVLASILRLIGVLGAMFISRQREYRADAISAKLTRNPMALAEALHIINSRWKGAGMPGEKMEAIFISNPRHSALEDTSNFISDLFTTHPPAQKRIAILLDMAHASEQDLDAALAKANTRFDTLYAKPKEETPAQAQWMVRGRQDGQWQGPFSFEQVKSLGWVLPGTAVKRMGEPVVLEARFDRVLGPMLQSAGAGALPSKDHCPRCQVPLKEESYEGVNVLRCQTCSGTLVKELDVLHIVHTRGQVFDERIAQMGQIIRRQVKPLRQNPFDGIYDEKSIVCPACLEVSKRMHRRFVSPQFPIEVDKCPTCARVWFDKDELEVLQYLYELDHPEKK
jgi:Zn-dependent protease with chaperone function/Zn-finger nucleic acid-binding protein